MIGVAIVFSTTLNVNNYGKQPGAVGEETGTFVQDYRSWSGEWRRVEWRVVVAAAAAGGWRLAGVFTNCAHVRNICISPVRNICISPVLNICISPVLRRWCVCSCE